MRIALGLYTCAKCASTFEAPILSELAYGEFLLWSSAGNVAYLNALEDPIYQEVKDLLSQRFSRLHSDKFELASVLKCIFGPMACDPDPTGAPYEVDGLPSCPSCASDRLTSWDVIDPPKIVEWDIPAATHNAWNRLSSTEKLEAIDRYVGSEKSATGDRQKTRP